MVVRRAILPTITDRLADRVERDFDRIDDDFSSAKHRHGQRAIWFDERHHRR
jgi:hypothetical protein